MNKSTHGLTLIELMIVVAIVGILAAIAYPSYQAQLRDARRADGQGALLELAQYMQRFYTENNRFDQDTGGAAVALPFTQSPRDPGDKYYNLSLQAVAATAYTLQAVPIGAQAGDDCGTMTLTQTGTKTPANCW
jgi:type IV pilus assembly protein PilE